MIWAYLLLGGWLALIAAWALAYRCELLRAWREPVLRHPVLVLESDDWGAGPLSQARWLRDIAAVLSSHQDRAGRRPCLNLALVLSVPDGAAMRATAGYRRLSLEAPLFADILAALRQGEAQGVFALQLHGLEHFWPATLMASDDPRVAAWLRQEPPATTEDLPSHLQSRWVDTGRLPSTHHREADIRGAAAEEIQAWRALFGAPPRVVVPPTFVWTREVERAWAAGGVEFVVTPGWRYPGRDAAGLPDRDEGPLGNGDAGEGVTYLARADYFEPRRGRDAAHALKALARSVREGRPCLLENHRDNFIRDEAAARHSLEELDRLFGEALKAFPGLRFLSTRELGEILKTRDPGWLHTSTGARLQAAIERLRNHGRLWKLATLTGISAMARLLARLWPRVQQWTGAA